MSKRKPLPSVTLTLDAIVGGGQTIGTLDDGRKMFVWGGLPGETIEAQMTRKKSSFAEGIVTSVITASSERIEPLDPSSYLSTSPWQIMTFAAEQFYKAALIEEAFELHDIVLPHPIEVYSDNHTKGYRNKVEFSWYGDHDDATGAETLSLAFFRRGSKGKIVIEQSSLLPPHVMQLAQTIRQLLESRSVSARDLKTLLIRSDQQKNCTWQLYVKTPAFNALSHDDIEAIGAQGGEVIYSDPRSPASVITKRLLEAGTTPLNDTILGVPFRYATEGFFQINLPVYEQALLDMKQWITPGTPTIDLYSGVGSIGLTIGGENVTLIEVNEHAVREMKQNIIALGREATATAILAASEHALDHLSSDATIIVDPPRAGLHEAVITTLLELTPKRIIYLSCNPVTQARDVARLGDTYGVRAHRGYNFFPRTPHIEHLVVLDLKSSV